MSETDKKASSLTPELIAKTAALSALWISPEEQQTFTTELSNILGYMENLNKIDVNAVSPTSHVHGSTNFFREDIAVESLPIAEGLSNTPDKSGRFIKVPIIIDQSGEH